MKDIMNFLKSHKYYLVVAILIFTSIVLSVTYSNYFVSSGNHRVAEMYIGSLKYSISIDNNETNTLTLEPGETIIDVNVNNLNPVDTYYKLLYLNNSNLTINYYSQTKDTSDNVTKYNKPNDSITSSGTNSIKLSIVNNSSSNQTISFSLKGGYINNTLSDISLPSGYSEINKEDTSTNTYFCYTDSALEQGTTYSDSIFAYAYKQKLTYNVQALRYSWINSNTDGWGVGLNDRTSTNPIVAKMCTYINNKPIKLMNYAFNNSATSSIDLSGVNSKNVVDMSFTFSMANSLLNLDKLVTNNVTNMSYMFSNVKMSSLDLSNLNTSKVTDMSYMFSSSKLTSIDLSKLDTSNVTNMYSIFSGMNLASLDLSNFDTSNATNIGRMFSNVVITNINLDNFNTSKVTNMSYMFDSCQIGSIDLSKLDTSKVTSMAGMFTDSSFTTLDLSTFDTSKVTSMSSMFSGSKATSINISNFDTSNVTNMTNMFKGGNVTTLDLSNLDTSKVTNMSYMFSNSNITTLDLSSFNTSKVKNMLRMFSGSTNLKTVYISDKFSTTAVTSSNYMFDSCTNLVGGSGTVYDSSKIDKTYARIDGGTSNPGYFTDIAETYLKEPVSFESDSWKTIVNAVKNNNISKYNIGDTKQINLGSTYGTHTVRISNMSTPDECLQDSFSQTACGFVLEFADVITNSIINDTNSDINGYPESSLYTFINTTLYNLLPVDLRNGIINTRVISSKCGSDVSNNFVTYDKLYLLASEEIYSDWKSSFDSSVGLTRTLDFYKNNNVELYNNREFAIKFNNDEVATEWWHRTKTSNDFIFFFLTGNSGGSEYDSLNNANGVSPAFRIG